MQIQTCTTGSGQSAECASPLPFAQRWIRRAGRQSAKYCTGTRSNFSVHSLRGGEQSTLFEGAQGDSWERLTSCQAQTGAVSQFKRVETTALEGDWAACPFLEGKGETRIGVQGRQRSSPAQLTATCSVPICNCLSDSSGSTCFQSTSVF